MATDKKRVTIYLSDSEKDALRELAEREGRSMSSQARISVMNDVQKADKTAMTAMPSNH